MGFSAYDYAQPPDCCLCPSAIDPAAPPTVNVTTTISGGYGQLAFMTRAEDAFQTIARTQAAEQAAGINQNYVVGSNFPMWREGQ